MIHRIDSFYLRGGEAVPVTVSCEAVPNPEGRTMLHAVGLAEEDLYPILRTTVRALQASGYALAPGCNSIIDIIPAIPGGEARQLMLPIALALIAASGEEGITFPDRCYVAGELKPDGTVLPVRGSLQLALSVSDWRIPSCVLAEANALDAYAVTGRPGIFGVKDVAQAVAFFKGDSSTRAACRADGTGEWRDRPDRDTVPERPPLPSADQSMLRAASIAAAGGFGLLSVAFKNPCMKGHCAPERMAGLIAGLLPPPDDTQDGIETDKTLSLAGLPYGNTFKNVPFQDTSALQGTEHLVGTVSEPGAATLAHEGVLLIRDAGSLTGTILTKLTEATESGTVTHGRGRAAVSWPADCQVVLAIRNDGKPFPKAFSSVTPIYCFVHPGQKEGNVTEEDIEAARRAVAGALRRGYGREGCPTARLDGIQTERLVSDQADTLEVLRKISEKLGFDAAEKLTCIRVARTIADLDEEERVAPKHVAEAAAYVTKHYARKA